MLNRQAGAASASTFLATDHSCLPRTGSGFLSPVTVNVLLFLGALALTQGLKLSRLRTQLHAMMDCFFTSQRKDFLPVTRMADQEPAPPGAGAEEELQPPGMEEEAPSAKIEEPAAIEPAPAAAPAAAPAVSAPVPPPVSAPVATPVSAPQAPPATSEPAAVIPTSAPPVAAVSAAPVSAPVAAPAPAAAPAASTQYAAQYAQYGYGAYPGYAPSMPVAGYGYDPAAYYYGGYYGHPAPTGNLSAYLPVHFKA